jgi:hypothetical protein
MAKGKGKNYFKNPSIDWKATLKLISKGYECLIYTEFIWLKIGIGSGLL